jgi:hypothetical protein
MSRGPQTDYWRTFLIALILAAALAPAPALAELKDFQIARYLITHSECILGRLTRQDNADGSWTYHGYCTNETFYPDGVDIHCPDPDNNDERSCAILTRKKRFPHLELLRRHGND